MRYGENPHQQAALYLPQGHPGRGIAQAEQVQGKSLSYNNYNDADAALELAAEYRDGDPACVIVKHANPCGVAVAGSLVEAYEAAFACDTVSAFGGIVAVNRPLDRAAAEAGATAVIQPGGSIRDEEVIAAADQAGLAMLFTGLRHFRH